MLSHQSNDDQWVSVSLRYHDGDPGRALVPLDKDLLPANGQFVKLATFWQNLSEKICEKYTKSV